MQKINNKNINSPIDLVTFSLCEYTIILHRKKILKNLVPFNKNNTNKLFAQKGLKHEKRYLKILKQNNYKTIKIPNNLSLKKRIKLTIYGIKLGIEVIYQAILYHTLWRGDIDFLIKSDRLAKVGNYNYEILDAKLSKKVEVKHIIQLCVYSELLSYKQNNLPKKIHIYLGNKERYSFKSIDFIHYFNFIKKKFLQFIRNNSLNLYPEPCNYCNLCEWKEHCKEKWTQDKNLNFLSNITNIQKKKLNNFGINNIKTLSKTKEEIITSHFNKKKFLKLKEQAILQNYQISKGKNKFLVISQIIGKGFDRIPKTSSEDLFFDMEGDPLYLNRLEYLFGLYYKKNNKNIFKIFWAHDHKEERKIFIKFIDFLKFHLKKHPNAYIYHYNHYEITALKRLSYQYKVYESQINNLLKTQKFIDLYIIVRESITVSESGYSIKNLETFYMNKRINIVTTAIDSIVVYNNWKETKEKQLLRKITQYNKIDCISTYLLRNWLNRLKLKKTIWFQNLKSNKLFKKIKNKKDKWNNHYYKYKNKLENIYLNDKKINKNLIYLLEFHNREAKAQWWNIFNRQNKNEDQIINDIECLGGLKTINKPYKEKKSLIYIYQYPEQETKIKKGGVVFNTETMDKVGIIININEKKRCIKIKRCISKEKLLDKISIGPGVPIDIRPMKYAIYSYVAKLIQNNNTDDCINSLLKRSIPQIKNRKQKITLVNNLKNIKRHITQIIINMDCSFLFIQGPPGTGKTYIISYIAIELMKKGKKIGITSNSHKVINNLLNKIEYMAKKTGFSFLGIKKASFTNKETYFQGLYIKNEIKSFSISLKINLFAGTVWLFSDERFIKQLDYLFVDEAGQMALANIIATSISTKNIILVGDQMQLKYPIEGTHPENSGLSVLEYLLKNNFTIPKNKGIFLSETLRLRPNTCKFISKLFYDTRLISHHDSIKKLLNLKNCNLFNEGIKFINIKHEDCSQKSFEEGNLIQLKFNELLDQKFNNNGNIKKIEKKNILVITPYNIQVNYLQSILHRNSKVGTVDNFQGQETLIVLISMATSNIKNLPKNIQFLHNKNRINVAISRSQCLAIIIANLQLLKISCKTVKQIKTINILCNAYLINQKNY